MTLKALKACLDAIETDNVTLRVEQCRIIEEIEKSRVDQVISYLEGSPLQWYIQIEERYTFTS